MARQQDQHESDPVVAAIERVLKAERDGVEKLRSSENHAQRLIADARAQAAAIGRRADACITRLHAAYLQKIQRDIERMDAGHPPSADGHFDHATLEAAARRVAAKLTGGS
jgi:regulator of protease activity HflC (stomatin/prohibitin superfamily)